MNIFIVSSYGDSLDLASKLQNEDNKVSIYVRNKEVRLPESDVEVTRNPTADMIKSELIIVEDTKAGQFTDRARELKRPIIGGGSVIGRISKDEKFGTDILLGCDLKLANDRTQGKLMEVGGWFSGSEFLKPYFLAFKYMRFGVGDTGPELGPMGIVGTYKLKGRIFRETLSKLETFLKSISYIGYIGLDILINNDNLQVVGWQPVLQFPTVNVLSKMHNNFGNFLFKVAVGKAKITAIQPDKVGIGITWLELPWVYENPVKNRPQILCECGGNIEEARSKLLKTVHKVLDPKVYYRTDIGEYTKNDIKELIKNGWL
jgi:hypothetical protein